MSIHACGPWCYNDDDVHEFVKMQNEQGRFPNTTEEVARLLRDESIKYERLAKRLRGLV